MTGRNTYLLLMSTIVVMSLPVLHQDAQAQSSGRVAPIPDAVAMVVGSREGQEVGRWAGEIMWDGPSPIEFTGRQNGKKWRWHPHEPEQFQILVSDFRPAGRSIAVWARTNRAKNIVIVIAPHPGKTASNGPTSRGVPKSHRRSGGADGSSQFSHTNPPADTAGVAAEANGNDQSNGLSDKGIGPGRGRSGDESRDGRGTDKGRSNGHAAGGTRASRIQNKRADLVTGRGGHTPADGGRKGGSAGGTQGGDGNILGLGWLGLIDAPERIAPLVNTGLILVDANILGFGHKMLSRVVRGMSARVLRRKLTKDAARVVAHDLAKVRDKLARSSRYRDLPVVEQQVIIKRAESAMTRAYFARAKTLFAEKATALERLAAKYATHPGRVQKRIRALATENATAYRKMARVAEAEHVKLATAVTTKPKPKLLGPRKSTKIVRSTPGTATGGYGLRKATGNWLHGTAGNAAPLPRQIADALRGRSFKTWDEFREAVWTAVAADKALQKPFAAHNIGRMKKGFAPRVHHTQRVGELKSYILHHRTPIQHGGGVYDLDNIVVVTPRYHQELLNKDYHF